MFPTISFAIIHHLTQLLLYSNCIVGKLAFHVHPVLPVEGHFWTQMNIGETCSHSGNIVANDEKHFVEKEISREERQGSVSAPLPWTQHRVGTGVWPEAQTPDLGSSFSQTWTP